MEDEEEDTASIVNMVSFVTNSKQVILYNVVDSIAQAEAILSLVRAAEVEVLILHRLPVHPATVRLGDYVRGSTTISSFGLWCSGVQPVDNPLVIRTFANALQNSASLTRICISDIHLDAESIRTLSDSLVLNTILTGFEVTSCTNPKEPITDLVLALRKVRTIRKILVWNMNLSIDNARAFSESMRFWPDLRTLRLFSVGLDPGCAKSIAEVLSQGCVCGLRKLNLSWNKNLGDEGIRIVAAGMIAGLAARKLEGRLRTLNLNNTGFASVGGEWVARLVEHCPCLKHVVISRNSIGESSGILIGKALRSSVRSLRSLEAHDCKLGPGAISAVCSSLRESIVLRSVNLNSNTCGAGGAKRVSQQLGSVSHLIFLWSTPLVTGSAGECQVAGRTLHRLLRDTGGKRTGIL